VSVELTANNARIEKCRGKEDQGHRSQREAAAMGREAVRLLSLCEADGTKVKDCAA